MKCTAEMQCFLFAGRRKNEAYIKNIDDIYNDI